MTKQEVMDATRHLSPAQQLEWLARLGWRLTCSARSGYIVGDDPGNITHLMGCNELQHQIFNRMNALRTAHDWPLEDFLDTLFQKAAYYGVAGDFGWALRTSLNLPK
jgi:hypothetical protein